MSLRTQLTLLVALTALLSFVGNFAITLDNTRHYLSAQLDTHAQDTATSLGLSLSTRHAIEDPLLMESMVDAIFDRGYYQEITVVNAAAGPVLERIQPVTVHAVPTWFVRWFYLATPRRHAELMRGWQRHGRVSVVAHPGHAYAELWRTLKETLWWSAFGLVVALLLSLLLLRVILVPLRHIEEMSRNIANRNYATATAPPRARELRSVVEAMNVLALKVQAFVQDLQQRSEDLRRLAYEDAVTGLANEAAFTRDLHTLVQDKHYHAYGCVVLVRVFGLEEVNQAHGVEPGNSFLIEVGASLQGAVTQLDCQVARLRGAEFGISVPDLMRADVPALAERLIDSIATLEIDPIGAPRTHIGVAYYGGGQSVALLLDRARIALSDSAGHGVSGWQLFDATDADSLRETSYEYRWRTILDEVLAEGGVVLALQRVVRLADGEIHHMEVLARIRMDDGQLVPAGVFWPMAARVGLTVEFDQQIVTQVLQLLREPAHATGGRLAVNLSRESVASEQFADWLVATLSVHPECAQRLTFEMSETVIAHDEDAALGLAKRLADVGAEIAVDHAGAREVELKYLEKLRPSYVKVGGSLCATLGHDENSTAYLRSLINLGHQLGTIMIAEHVDSPDMLALVNELGFDAGQGELLAPSTL